MSFILHACDGLPLGKQTDARLHSSCWIDLLTFLNENWSAVIAIASQGGAKGVGYNRRSWRREVVVGCREGREWGTQQCSFYNLPAGTKTDRILRGQVEPAFAARDRCSWCHENQKGCRCLFVDPSPSFPPCSRQISLCRSAPKAIQSAHPWLGTR